MRARSERLAGVPNEVSATAVDARRVADPPVAERLAQLDWSRLGDALDARGWATTGPLLEAQECRTLRGLYGEAARFRKRVVMRQHAFGEGEYKYFAYPLPDLVAELRAAAYPFLAPVANRWRERLRVQETLPNDIEEFLGFCHQLGQVQPTPLLLKYGPGDYNRLHQDLYGELYFPLQMTLLLSAPDRDFSGGEFILTEQKPRTQSRAHVVPLAQGEAVIFAVHHRPAEGHRGYYRLSLRHGVSTVRTGERYCLGVIFHDAK